MLFLFVACLWLLIVAAVLIAYFDVWAPELTAAEIKALSAHRRAEFRRNPVSALFRFIVD